MNTYVTSPTNGDDTAPADKYHEAGSELEEWKVRALKAERELAALQREMAWETEWFRSDQIGAADKLVGWTLRRFGPQAKREEKPQPIYIQKLSEHVGLGRDRSGTALRRLNAAGVIVYETVYDRQTKRKRAQFLPRPAFDAPATITAPAPKNGHGGRRLPTCAHCGPNTSIVEMRPTTATFYCKGCGEQIGTETATAKHEHIPVAPPQTMRQVAAIVESTVVGDVGGDQPLLPPLPVIDVTPTMRQLAACASDSDNCIQRAPTHTGEPVWLAPLSGNFPQAVLDSPRWMVWRAEPAPKADGTPAWSKAPRDWRTGRKASETNPEHQGTIHQALEGMARHGVSGVGLAPKAGDGLVFVDIDNCRDEESGELVPEAQAVLGRFGASYTEASPSGRGVRKIMRGELPADCASRWSVGGIEVEIYATDAFVTITGHRLEGAPATVHDRTAEITALWAECQPGALPAPPRRADIPVTRDDATLLDAMRRSRIGPKFGRLWAGDWSEFKSRSDGRVQLVLYLGWWTGYDAERVTALFRQSGLWDTDWDEKHYGDGRTKGEGTIEKLFAGKSGRVTRCRDIDQPASAAAAIAGTHESYAFSHPTTGETS